MKKVLISMGFAALALGATAQVKIKDGSVTGSSTTPNSNAILELESNNKGLLYPRVSLTATNAVLPGRTMVAGMVVYNTATAGSGATAVTPGFYYSDGTVWVRLIDAPATSTAWSLTGNAGTTPATNFIGTTDNQDIVFKVNNTQAGLLDNANFITAFGVGAMGLNNTGITAQANTAVGYNALYSLASNVNAYGNAAVGYMALYSDSSGIDNVAIGRRPLELNKTGVQNVAVGSFALQNLSSLTNSSNNVAIGYQAAVNQTSGNNNISLGYNANFPNTTGNYQLNIGNAIFGTGVDSTVSGPGAANIGINTNAPNSSLQIAGSVSTPINAQGGISISYTLGQNDYTYMVTGTGSSTVTLPDPSTCTGRMYRLVNESTSGTFTLAGYTITTLTGTTSSSIPAGTAALIQSTGVFWRQVGQ